MQSRWCGFSKGLQFTPTAISCLGQGSLWYALRFAVAGNRVGVTCRLTWARFTSLIFCVTIVTKAQEFCTHLDFRKLN